MDGTKAKRPRTDGEFVIDFFECLCRHTEGPHATELVVLEQFQRQLLIDLFELRPNGRRRYRKALIGMPRKNAKSMLGSGLALHGLIADGELGAQVFSCAGDKEQAKVVFNSAKRMVELEPELSAILKCYRDVIEYPATGSVYRALSAEAFTKEGLNPSRVIFDEVHVQPNRELWDVMTLGSGTRLQPLTIGITTAGFDLDSLCGALYLHGTKVRSGEIVDPSFFFRWWEPRDPKCDWKDPKVWAECNPALNLFLFQEALEEAALEKPENVFRRYHLNQWTSTATAWLPFGAWDACEDGSLGLDPALPIHVGIDLGLKHDSSAVVIAQRRAVEQGAGDDGTDGTVREDETDVEESEADAGPKERTVIRCRIWENPWPVDSPHHGEWKLNIVEVENYLRELFLAYPEPACEIDGAARKGPEYRYDPYLFERSAQLLEAKGAGLEGAESEPFSQGLAMVEFGQNDSRMIPASQNLYQLIVDKRLAHDGDPHLARHVGNVIAEQKRGRGAWRMSKPKGSAKKIDGAIATAIAALAAQNPAPKKPKMPYQDRGIEFV